MNNKFSELDIVMHIATGKKYVIFATPNDLVKIEATGKPCYFYEEKDSEIGWLRPKDEMEDGRFEKAKIEKAPHSQGCGMSEGKP